MSAMIASFAALVLGFAFNAASASTTRLAARFGIRRGLMATVLLRDVLGIPLWVAGLAGTIARPAPALIETSRVLQYAAAGLIGAGSLVIAWALLSLRRRAAAPSVLDQLEQGGPYAFVRHPIHAGVILQLPGILLLWPTAPVGLACLMTLGWIGVQARLEERDLVERLPEYCEYMRQVPRFFPRLARKRA
jgi:protein-S-isoprenylcysteine O-methyltransferase Ste14